LTTPRRRPARNSFLLAVEALDDIELLVPVSVRTRAKRFLVAEGEDAEAREALVEEIAHALLQAALEVDHHVPANDHVVLVEGAVGREVVLREDDVPHQRSVE